MSRANTVLPMPTRCCRPRSGCWPARVRGTDVLTSPAVVKDFLRARLGNLPHEIFAVVHLDAQHRVLDYVEMFRGTVSQTSVYPREVIKDALSRNSSALLLVHSERPAVPPCLPMVGGRGWCPPISLVDTYASQIRSSSAPQ